MMKSRQSVTKLRLSRIIKCLLVLGCIKLAIIAAAAFDFSVPFVGGTKIVKQPENLDEQDYARIPAAAAKQAAVSNSEQNNLPPQDTGAKMAEEMPQGSAAAELAAAAKPRKVFSGTNTALPAPLVTAVTPSLLTASGNFSGNMLTEPLPLGEPLVRAGVILPVNGIADAEKKDNSLWDMFSLKDLPVPVLGSAQAAALDMPVPSAPKTNSPFTPAEQAGALNPQSRSLPDAPPLSSAIPSANTGDGSSAGSSPSAMRQGYAPLPQSVQSAAAQMPPAPNITAQQTSINPNMKAQELARQQQDILILRQQMDQRLKDLRTAEDKMKEMLKEAQAVEDKKVKSLIQMYANMKPRTAAQALENMDERIAVRILSGMAPKQSGEILTYTNPVKTAKFTEMITRMRMSD